MKSPFHLWLLLCGTLLTLSPVLYKTAVTLILAWVVVKEHRADISVGEVELYLGFTMFCGIVMIIIAIVSNARRESSP